MVNLIYMIGIPGSGKSTIAMRMATEKGYTYISSDSIRKEVLGKEEDQSANGMIFNEMQKRTVQNLKEGKGVIYDATNISRKNRINFLKSLPKDTFKECVVVWARIDTCVERDSKRNRSVGEEVILKMVKRFQTPWYDEGWDNITFKMNDDRYYNHKDFALDISHDNPHHPGTIEEHISRVVKEVQELYANEVINYFDFIRLEIVAKLHDIGKPLTKTFINKKGETTDIAHYYDHQNVSAYIALGWEDLWYLSNGHLFFISWLVNMHMEPFFDESNYYKNINPECRKLIETFNECDKKGA